MPDTPSDKVGRTQREYEILKKMKLILPKPFLEHEDSEEILNDKLLAYADLVIDDINYVHPQTGYSISNFPNGLDTILFLGMNAYSALFMQAKWTLNDISYTDNGFSVTLGRVEKLNTSYKNFLELYEKKTQQVKDGMLFNNIIALGTPRYQNQLGQFVRATFGWSF